MQAAKKYAIIVGAVLAAVIIVGLIVAGIFHVLLDVLYIALFILAMLMVAATLFQIYSIAMLVRTVQTVRDEMKPLIASVQETVGLVKDTAQSAGHTVSTIGSTANFAAEFGVKPTVRTVAFALASQEVVRVFFGKGHARSRADERRKQQLDAMQATRGGE